MLEYCSLDDNNIFSYLLIENVEELFREYRVEGQGRAGVCPLCTYFNN